MANPIPTSVKPMILIILDGWGVAEDSPKNAISQAKTPNLDSLFRSYPHTKLEAAGEPVGLPHGESGNSEVGHLCLGSGRVVYQELQRINTAIADGSFLENEVLNESIKHAKTNNSNIHLMGLIGSGAVHSSVEHLYALLWLIKKSAFQKVYLHFFTDGRDSPPESALQLFNELEIKLTEIKLGKIVTISGRYYAMDRDNRWYKTAKVYDAIVNGIGAFANSVSEAIEQSYQKKAVDEFIEPTIIQANDNRFVSDNDTVIFFNFRPDRSRQLAKAFVADDFYNFDRGKKLDNVYFVSMSEYDKNLKTHTAFPAPRVSNPLSFVVSTYNIRQLHISETEKYAHVTYFFNGGAEAPFHIEDRIHIPSPKVQTYDIVPEMSAYKITDYVVDRIKSGHHGFYVINFANADMVAHTGSMESTVRAVEVIDECIGRIVDVAEPLEGTTIVVGDHGNAEQMENPITKAIDTEHTTNSVPFLIVSKTFRGKNTQLQSGTLADVAPTILAVLGLPKPNEMTGRNLLM